MPLVNEFRGGVLENLHIGMICGVNDKNQTIYQVGDTEQLTYFRSAAKPIQALPVFLTSIITKYGLTDNEASLFTASHRGESYHIQALESMLKKLPLEEDELFCPPSYPLNEKPKEEMIRNGIEKRRLFHNCSGKHMGFITVCKEKGYPVEGYWQKSHPLQKEIVSILSMLSDAKPSEIHYGIDGCGVPVFAIPLNKMAKTYLRLACPDLIADTQLREAVLQMTKTMNQEYNMIASEQFICSVLLKDTNIVAKGGAKGVYCFGLKKERLGFAIKILNGAEAAWPNVVAAILEQINYENEETVKELRSLRPTTIRNDSGMEVGDIKEVFSL